VGKLTDGLQPPRDGTEERLDRVLKGMELLLGRAGVSLPDPAPSAADEPQAERVVKLREKRGKNRR